MGFILIALVAAATFGLCYGLDKGFAKLFRSQKQHESGLSVRLNKKYGAAGLIIGVLGVAAVLTGLKESWLLSACGVILVGLGACLVVYYMSFGIFYDEDSFILSTFGKKTATYCYRDIRSQQLYNSYGTIVIELHMADGRAVQLQSSMLGVYSFMDKAFAGWLRQKGLGREDCPFHDPANSCWFPSQEV